MNDFPSAEDAGCIALICGGCLTVICVCSICFLAGIGFALWMEMVL